MKTSILATRTLRLIMRLKKIIGNMAATQRAIYVNDRTGFYMQMWKNAAIELDADFKTISHDFWEISKDFNIVHINNYLVPLDDPVTLNLAGNKDLCYRLMGKINLPIPAYTVFDISQLEKGIRFFKEKEGPFAVKPSSSTSGGRGVSILISKYKDFISAVALSSLYDKRILIEKMIPGESYRLLFLGNKFLHAARRTGVRVIGDGSSSLLQLVENVMMDNGIKSNLNSALKNDADLKFTIKSQNYSIDTVPEKMQPFLVKSLPLCVKGSPETIAQYTENITGKISRSIIETAQKACVHLGVFFAGVDLITTDPTIPLERSGGAIIEVNSTPGLHHHYNLEGQSEDDQPAVLVLKHLLSSNKTKYTFQ